MAYKSLIFLIDVSGCMADRLNFILEELEFLCKSVLPNIVPPKDIDLSLKIMTFSQHAEWVCREVPFDKIEWDNIKKNISIKPGGSRLGEAINLVYDTLYYGDQLFDPSQLAPMIVLMMSGGIPTDDYKTSLYRAIEKKIGDEKQGLFARSSRIAIGFKCHHEYEKEMMIRFGHLSKSLMDKGFKTYYEVNIFDSYKLREILNEVIQIFTTITGFRNLV